MASHVHITVTRCHKSSLTCLSFNLHLSISKHSSFSSKEYVFVKTLSTQSPWRASKQHQCFLSSDQPAWRQTMSCQNCQKKKKKRFGNSWRNSRKWKKHWRVHSTWIANPHLCMSFLPFLSARSSTLAFLPACKAWRWSLGAKKPSFYLLLFKCNLGMEFWDGYIYIYMTIRHLVAWWWNEWKVPYLSTARVWSR